jgi:HlyD family secretion protein
MNPNVDLRQLAVRRDAAELQPATRSRHLLLRYLLPGGVLLGFLGVLAWAARDSLLPSRPVTVVPVIATRVEVQPAGTPLFQAAGWVEPRPTPVLVTALVEGVIEQLRVVEGQEVKAGDIVATLIDADARLALEAALADLQLRENEADALLARADVDKKYLPYQLQSAEAMRRLARIDLDNKKNSSSVPLITIHKAESELATLTAKVEELTARKQQLEREVVSLRRLREAFRKEAADAADSFNDLTEAEANMRAALSRIRQAQVAVDMARLRLERMTVKAPCSGRVLALLARPGMKLMGLAPHAMHEASTVVSLYDPLQLQIRADVRFEDLPRVVPGQPVRIETPAVAGGLDGEVLFPTSQADIQKNTLQVKVAVKSPPPVLKPDMLVQVTFLAPARTAPAAPSEQLRLFLPRQVVETAEAGAFVWLADQAARTARRRPIKLGLTAGDLVEVVEGLTAADKAIVGGREGLTDGARITVLGEDATLGTTSGGAGRSTGRQPRIPTGHQGKH